MMLPRPFTLGLCAYLRQAGLSLDRAPGEYRKAMIEYYEQHSIPFPSRVLAELDRFSRGQDREMAGGFLDVLLGRAVALKIDDLAQVRGALHRYDQLLTAYPQAAHADRMSVRLDLSYAATLLRKRLRLRSDCDAECVEHLNSASWLRLRSLSQIAGSSWPGAS